MFIPHYRIILCLIASYSVLSTGMGLAYPSISTNHFLTIFTPEQVSWLASITAITMIVTGLFSGYFCDLIGRKGTLIFNDIVAILSFLIIRFASGDFLFIQLIIARALIGSHIGMATTAAVMYIAEICSPKIRGTLSMMSSPFFTALGMVIIYFLGAFVTKDHHIASFFAAGIAFKTLLLLLIIPESPVFYVNKNQEEKARNSFSKILSIAPQNNEITAKIKEIQSRQKLSLKAQFYEFKKPQLYKPFIIMLLYFTLQQFSGIFIIFVFAAQFAKEVGISMDPDTCAFYIGIIRMIAVLSSAYASDKFGRKPLSTFSFLGMFAAMCGLVSIEYLTFDFINLLRAAFLFTFVSFGTFGAMSLPFAMLAEIYPQSCRGLAIGMTIFYSNFLIFINTKIFLFIFEAIGKQLIFIVFAFVSFLGILFSHFVLVETKGKSLQDIEELFEPNKISTRL